MIDWRIGLPYQNDGYPYLSDVMPPNSLNIPELITTPYPNRIWGRLESYNDGYPMIIEQGKSNYQDWDIGRLITAPYPKQLWGMLSTHNDGYPIIINQAETEMETLDKVNKPTWDNGFINWTYSGDIENVENFKIDLYLNGFLRETHIVDGSITSYDFKQLIDESKFSSYQVTVQALGNNIAYLDGAVSEMSDGSPVLHKEVNMPVLETVDKPIWYNGIISWRYYESDYYVEQFKLTLYEDGFVYGTYYTNSRIKSYDFNSVLKLNHYYQVTVQALGHNISFLDGGISEMSDVYTPTYKNILKYNYRYFLCRPDKTMASNAELQPRDASYTPRFRNSNELKLSLNYYTNDWVKEKDNNFDKIKNNYIIKMETRYDDLLIKEEYFTIYDIVSTGISDDYKELTCLSYESVLERKVLRGYNQVRKLVDLEHEYDLTDETRGGILDYIIKYKLNNSWTIGYVHPDLLDIYRNFEISEKNLISLMHDLEEQFNCIFEYDTVNNIIHVDLIEEYGENEGLFLSDENYLNDLNITIKDENIKTRLFVYGHKNIGVTKYNITGQQYIDNFTYYRKPEYMSQDLLDALNAYDLLLESKQGDFTTYLNNLDSLEESLLTKQNELADLNIERIQLEDNEDIAIAKGTAYGEPYAYWHNLWKDKIIEINTKQNEIDSIQDNINTVHNDINTLRNEVSYESNFTSEQLKQLNPFIKEHKIVNDVIDDEKILYEYAVDYLKRISTPTVEIKLNAIDIFSSNDCYLDWKKVKIGNFANAYYDKFGLDETVRIVQYTHDIKGGSLSLEFTNKDQLNLDAIALSRLQKKLENTSNVVENERTDYKKYIEDEENIIKKGENLNSENNSMIMGDGSIIDRRGMFMRDVDSASGQMRILGNRIVFTRDNWETYSLAITSDGIQTDGDFRLFSENNAVIIDGDGIDIYGGVSSNALRVFNQNNELVFNLDSQGNIVVTNGSIYSPTIFNTKAGITDEGDLDNAIRIWAGSDFENRETAPLRITQGGQLYAEDALISGDVVGSRFFGSSINSAFVEIGVGGSSNLADFGVFRGGSENYPVFSVYDNLTTIDLRVGGGNNTPLSFLTVEVDANTTRTYGTWDFLGATVTNLGNYMTSSAIQAAISNAIAQHIIDYH